MTYICIILFPVWAAVRGWSGDRDVAVMEGLLEGYWYA